MTQATRQELPEVLNVDTAIAAVRQMHEDATAELGEAASMAARAEGDFRRVEAFVAGIASLDFPQDVQQAAAALVESSRVLSEAAAALQRHAELRHAQARRLLELLERHRAIQDQAAAAGGMAHREAYQPA